MKLEVYNSDQWKFHAENAHMAVFGEVRPAEMNRIDFALLTHKDNLPIAFCTCRELDDESVYMQYGGAFKPGSPSSFISYSMFIGTLKENYNRVTTLIQNTNIVMLKFAMKVGFRIIGIRNFNNEIFCELLLDFKRSEV